MLDTLKKDRYHYCWIIMTHTCQWKELCVPRENNFFILTTVFKNFRPLKCQFMLTKNIYQRFFFYDCMRNNPVQTISIYIIPRIVRDALPLAQSPSNINSQFYVSEIWTTKWIIFTEEEFLHSAVTNRLYFCRTERLYFEVSSPQAPEQAFARQIAQPPSAIFCALSATFTTVVDHPCCPSSNS